MPDFELSAHAETVLAERSIPREWVQRVLENPDRIEPGKEGSNVTHALAQIPEHGDRVLRVIYNHSAKPFRIVTA